MIDTHIFKNKDDSNIYENGELLENESINVDRVTLDDFEFELLLGKGTYCTVFKTKFKPNQKNYALKKLDKKYIIQNKKQKDLIQEKKLLMQIKHPNIVKLYQTFQDDNYVYFMYEYVKRGTLARMIRKFKHQFPLELARFYAAEIVQTLEQIKLYSIVHRDLQSQNILIDRDYHLKICDFGDALKISELDIQNQTRQSHLSLGSQQGNFVGSIFYAPPELIEDNYTTFSSDLWSVGVLIYEMIVGELPFKSDQVWETMQKILNMEYRFPVGIDPQAQDLIKQLLQREPNLRLGGGLKGSSNDFNALKRHPFFNGVDFVNLYRQAPPIKKNRDQSPFSTFQTCETEKSDNRSNGSSNRTKSHIKQEVEEVGTFGKLARTESEVNIITLKKRRDTKLPPKANTFFSPPSNRSQVRDNMINIKEIKRGQLKKKNRFFINQIRIFVLTSEPRLKYYKNLNDFRGEIPLTQEVSAELLKDGSFKLQTPRKMYIMKEILPGDAQDWVININKAVKLYSQNLTR